MPVSAMRGESMASMKMRINGFLRDQILPLMADRATSSDAVIAVVAHGMILQVLWSCLSDLFGSQSFHLARTASTGDYMHPVWSNTGVMELDIRPGGPPQEMLLADAVRMNVEPPWLMKARPPTPLGGNPPLIGWSVTILAVDSTLHLE
jgi:broad specificity phosphatase PhoE